MKVRGVYVPYVNLDWFVADENLDEIKQIINVNEGYSRAACRNGALATITYLVESRQLKPNFIEACQSGNLDVIKYAVSILGTVEYDKGFTIVCAKGFLAVAQYLIAFVSTPEDVIYDYLYGAIDLNIDVFTWLFGVTKLVITEEMLATVDSAAVLALAYKPSMKLAPLLINAAGKDNIDIITYLMANVNYTAQEKARAFIEACRLGRVDAMTFLLPNVGRPAKVRGINHALVNGQMKLVRRLYKATNLVKADVIVRNLPSVAMTFISTMDV